MRDTAAGAGEELGLRSYSMLDQKRLEAVDMRPTSVSWSKGPRGRGMCLGVRGTERRLPG